MPQTMANPLDIAIGTSLNKDLKSSAAASALSACECTSPELRQTFMQISQESIRIQERLARLMHQKGWYVPPRVDQATVSNLIPQVQAAIQGLGGTLPHPAETPVMVTVTPDAAPTPAGAGSAPRVP